MKIEDKGAAESDGLEIFNLSAVNEKIKPDAETSDGGQNHKAAKENKNHDVLIYWISIYLFPAIVVYYEIVFHLSSVGGYDAASFLIMLMFSLGTGFLCQGIRSIINNKKARVAVTVLLMFAVMLSYLVYYFVFLQFKVFYDINTVLFGGGDAANGFAAQILSLILSFEGISHIFLFFLPIIAYEITRRVLKKRGIRFLVKYHSKKTAGFLVTAAIIFMTATSIVRGIPVLRKIYADQYSFSNVIRKMGLLTAIRRDVVRLASGEGKSSSFTFAEADEEEETKPVKDTGEKTEEKVVYGDNILNIDFEALSAQGGVFSDIDRYVASLKPTPKNEYTGLFKGKNLIFLTLESFSGFVIDEKHFPTLYRMQRKGIYITEYYQQFNASTTGGEYELLKGILPMAGAASMTNTAYFHNYMTIGSFLDREGYFGQMYHNGDSWYYSRDLTHNRLGYSEPYMAYGSGLDQIVEHYTPRSDREMIEATLPLYIDKDKFNIYYMTVSGHCPYSPASLGYAANPYGTAANGGNYFSEENIDLVSDLKMSDLLKNFVACQIEVEKAVASLVEKLDEAGVLEDTVIVMSADHFPYGIQDGGGYEKYLEELYGFPIKNDLDRDRNGLIIWSPVLEEKEPVRIDKPVSTIDVLPTLLNLFGCNYDSRLLPGKDILSGQPGLVFNTGYDWTSDYGTYIAARSEFTLADGVKEEDLPYNYVEKTNAEVANKISYCSSLTYNDYYYHVFGEEYPGNGGKSISN